MVGSLFIVAANVLGFSFEVKVLTEINTVCRRHVVSNEYNLKDCAKPHPMCV